MKRSVDATPRHIDNIPKRLLTSGSLNTNVIRAAAWTQATAIKSNHEDELEGKPKNLSLKSDENKQTITKRAILSSSSTDSNDRCMQHERISTTDKQSSAQTLEDPTHCRLKLLDSIKDLSLLGDITQVKNTHCHENSDTQAHKQCPSTSPITIPIASPTEQCTTAPNSNSAKYKSDLFENEAQSSLLDLAKAASSTLAIHVYHRCFGKSSGLFYPALLIDSGSECIECVSCEKMMSPMKFVGHTHHSRETNVCHWGFNPYNWRYYIKLSSKQASNSLDRDELLIQFSTLQSAPNSEGDKLLASQSILMPAMLHHNQNDFLSPHLADNTFQLQHPSFAECPVITTQSGPHPAISLTPSIKSQMTLQQVTGPAHQSSTYDQDSRTAPEVASSSRSINDQYSMPSPNTGIGGTLSYADPITRYGLSLLRPRHHAFNIELQREIYVTSNLTTYLHALGLNGDIINHITQTTLDIVRKSRLLL